MSDVTRILNEIEQGSVNIDRLLPAVYSELRQLAAAKMAHEKAGHTLDGTALVHEAFLRLAGNQSFASRKHFFGAAAEAMRRILIDHARTRNAKKRGGEHARADVPIDQIAFELQDSERLESLNEALEKFEAIEPVKANLVKLRYFAGLKIHEAAEILGISTATADRYWAYSRAWLQTELA